jgi:tRNA nucleotidyltransferase/poly(A) polymerase
MPYICGGIPRDKVIGESKGKYQDLDITTGDKSVRFLAEEFAHAMGQKFNIKKKVADDGHVSVDLSNLKIDFSSNNVDPSINAILAKKGIHNPTELQREMFSRDFTCNALLLSLDLKTILDPTKLGMKDIKERMVRTCLEPELTLGRDAKRIVRAIYIAAKLDFDLDPKIISWIKQHSKLIVGASDSYMVEKLDKAMEYNPKRTVALLNATDVWNWIPRIERLEGYRGKVNEGQEIVETGDSDDGDPGLARPEWPGLGVRA